MNTKLFLKVLTVLAIYITLIQCRNEQIIIQEEYRHVVTKKQIALKDAPEELSIYLKGKAGKAAEPSNDEKEVLVIDKPAKTSYSIITYNRDLTFDVAVLSINKSDGRKLIFSAHYIPEKPTASLNINSFSGLVVYKNERGEVIGELELLKGKNARAKRAANDRGCYLQASYAYVYCTAGGNHAPGQACEGTADQQPYVEVSFTYSCTGETEFFYDLGGSYGETSGGTPRDYDGIINGYSDTYHWNLYNQLSAENKMKVYNAFLSAFSVNYVNLAIDIFYKRPNLTLDDFNKLFVNGYSPYFIGNITNLSPDELEQYVLINQEISVSPYEEDYVKETNHIFVAFASSGYLNNPNDANLAIATNNMCCVGVGTLPAGWFLITQTNEKVKEITANYAALRNLYPNWSKWKCFWEATRDTIQLLLDIGGTVPLIGEVCDLTNGVIYTMNGDALNASLSYASAIPLVGWGSAAAKFAVRGVELANGARTTLKFLKRIDGIVEFGNRSQLRKVLGLLKGDLRQAHHIIPWELTSNSAVQKAALSSKAFHLNEALNGIPLSSEIIHFGSHPNYNQRVLNRLQSISPNKTPNEVYDEIMNIISDIRNAIKNNPNTPVDQLIF